VQVEPSLEQQLESYRNVASDVAHDLNNLLFLISGYTELLSKNLDNRDQVLQIVRSIQTATTDVRHLTEKLQAISEITGRIHTDDHAPAIREVLLKGHYDRNEVEVRVVIHDVELRELVVRTLVRGGFRTSESTTDDFEVKSDRDIEPSANFLIIDVEGMKGSGDESRHKLLETEPSHPTLFLINAESEFLGVHALSNSSSLTKPFLPSQLISAIDELHIKSK
jgi:hypothetical protein